MQHSRDSRARQGRLVLEDGSIFRGQAFGAVGVTMTAEVVFNTAMCGYQESITDPSYTGQILVQTFPMIGNYGVNADDVESDRVAVSGFIVRELARKHSNFRATLDLDQYLKDAGVPGLAGVDTRALTLRLRERGSLRGVLTDDAAASDAELLQIARAAPSMAGADLVARVGRSETGSWAEGLGEWAPSRPQKADEPLRVLAIDCGAKQNILRNLVDRGCTVELAPATITAGEIRARVDKREIDGVFLSNGPGDPAAVQRLVAELRELLAGETPVPVFGICLGHQLLALALGAKTYKMKFGHRGVNQPVFDIRQGRVEITSQNHGFAVDADSLEACGGKMTHLHLNDRTVAGFEACNGLVFAVQHHPEASPGPHDASVEFDRFVAAMRDQRSVRSA